jgi:hypothetical protein
MSVNYARVHLVLYAEHLDRDELTQTLQLKRSIKRWALCLHDKDGDMKPHYHVLMDFGRSFDTTRIPAWFPNHPGIEESRLLEPIKSWTAMVQYLIHKNDPNKYQYPATAVVSSYDISEDLNSSSGVPSWFGQFDQRDYFYHLQWIETSVPGIFQANKFYKAVKERYNLYLQAQEGSERDMKVIFVEGPPRIGKSTFARFYAKSRNKSYFQSSSSNDPLDGYSGQSVLILDDLRDSIFSLTDLLKLLDNHGSSLIKSRYNNKHFSGTHILITSVVPLSKWYKGLDSKVGNEPLQQLYGRVDQYVVLRELPEYSSFHFKVDKNTGEPSEDVMVPTEHYPFDVHKLIPQDNAYSDETDTKEVLKAMHKLLRP